jgi:hypothetical protein
MYEWEINYLSGEELMMEYMAWAKTENKDSNPKTMVAGQKVPELVSDEKLVAEFNTVRNPPKTKKRIVGAFHGNLPQVTQTGIQETTRLPR